MLVVPRVTIETYGSAANGVVASLTQVVGLFLVVEAGLSNAAMLSLYAPLASGDRSLVLRIVASVERLYRQVGIVFISLVVVLALAYPNLLSVPGMSKVEVAFLAIILGANGATDFLAFAKYRVFLAASQRSYVVSRASALYLALGALIIFGVAECGGSLVQGRALAAIALACKWWLLRRSAVSWLGISRLETGAEFSSIPKRGDVVLQQVLGAVQVGAPAILATVFTSLESVSVLYMYSTVALGITSILGIVSSGATAGFGDMIARCLDRSLRRAYSDLEFLYGGLCGVVFGVGLALIVPFMAIFVGGLDHVAYEDPILGMLVCVNGWLYAVKAPQGMMIIAAGHFRETRYRVVAQAIIIVIGGTVLGALFGLVGILLASMISNLYRVFDLLFYISTRITHLPISHGVRRLVRSAFLLAVTVGVTDLLWPRPMGWADLIIQGTAGLVLGSVVAIGVGLLTEKRAMRSLWVRLGSRRARDL